MGIAEVLGGEDTHSKNQEAFKLPSRLIAKVFLFRCIYRGSGWSYANDPDFMHVSTSAAFWDDMNEKFYDKYKGIDLCHKKWAQEVMAGKPIVGPLGRQWQCNNRDKFGNTFVPWTTLTNYPVQGSGADIMMLARISAFNRIKKLNLPGKFVSTVHDSIVYDCPEEVCKEVAEIFHAAFANIPTTIAKLYGYTWYVPMTAECKIGKNMLEMSKFS